MSSLPSYDITQHEESMEQLISYIVETHNSIRPSSKRTIESSQEALDELLIAIKTHLTDVRKECAVLSAVHGYYEMSHGFTKSISRKNIVTHDLCIHFKFNIPTLTPYPTEDNYATYIINVSLYDVYRRYKKKAYVTYC